jgi:hypothetical protein
MGDGVSTHACDPYPECCPVCLDDYGADNTVALPCGHAFHLDCVTNQSKVAKTTSLRCAMCRSEFACREGDKGFRKVRIDFVRLVAAKLRSSGGGGDEGARLRTVEESWRSRLAVQTERIDTLTDQGTALTEQLGAATAGTAAAKKSVK